jgi:hypothetical protein
MAIFDAIPLPLMLYGNLVSGVMYDVTISKLSAHPSSSFLRLQTTKDGEYRCGVIIYNYYIYIVSL